MIIDRDKCKFKGIFLEIMKLGNITRNEMYKVFNWDWLCLILDRKDVEKAKKLTQSCSELTLPKTGKIYLRKLINEYYCLFCTGTNLQSILQNEKKLNYKVISTFK